MTIKDTVFKVLSRFGLGERAVRLASKIGYFEELRDNYIRGNFGSNGGQRGIVLFPYPKGRATKHIYKYNVLSEVYKELGYDTLFILCDNVLPACIYKGIQDSKHCAQCKSCSYYGKKVTDGFGNEFLSLSECVRYERKNYEGTYRGVWHDGINVEKYTKSTYRKLKKRHKIREEQDRKLLSAISKTVKYIIDVYRWLLEKKEVRLIVSHDDKYAWGGIPLEVGREKDIYTYSTALGWKPDSLVLGETSRRSSFPHFEPVNEVKQIISNPLNDNEKKWINKFMKNRFEGQNQRTVYTSTSDKTINTGYDKNFGMFTNLIWDGSLETNEGAFPSVINWIAKTIEYYEGRSRQALIIKCHPAEKVRGTNEPVHKIIEQRYDINSIENVFLLMPNTKISTYQLIEDIDAAIVYNSTVGLEAAYLGLPVIVGGETHYRNLGFTFDPSDKEEYVHLLNGAGDLSMDEKKKKLAKRYAHFLFYKKHIPFKYFPDDDGREAFEQLSRKEVVTDPNLKKIAEKTIRGEMVLA